MSTTRDAYIDKMKLQLDELNTSIDDLQAKTKGVKDDVREKYNEEMANLRYQSQLAVAKFDDLKLSTEETWGAMVTEMENIRDAFKHSFKYFKSQI